MAKAASRLTTVEAFLAFEGEPDTRYQLIRGAITAMAPARLAHGQLVARLARLIGNRLRRPCEAITEAGVKPAHRNDTYWQADLVVLCQKIGSREVYSTEPRLIVEVLSPSTEAVDRLLKLIDYRLMPSVEDILLVATSKVHVEHWQRRGDLWTVRDLGPGATITVEALGLSLALDDLYADMPLEEGGVEA